jgi:uncharacterized membrane protein
MATESRIRQQEGEGEITVQYDQIAGRSLVRLAALSDGIFAVAMTILVLDLHAPVIATVHTARPLWETGALQSEQVLLTALVHLWPSLLSYLMSFLTLGIFWGGQQTQLEHLGGSDRRLQWLYLAFLLTVALLPFSTALLSAFITYRLALLIYWVNLVLLGATLLASWQYAAHAGLLKEDVTAGVRAAVQRRILTWQSLYAAAAALCVVSTYLSIGLLVTLQLTSVMVSRRPAAKTRG